MVPVVLAQGAVDLYVTEVSQRCVANEGIRSRQTAESPLVNGTGRHILCLVNEDAR